MNSAKKVKKIIREIIKTIFLLCILFVLVVYVYHKITCKQEYNLLNDYGYVNIVMARDCSLNVTSYGNRYGKHTIVALSGLDNSEYSCTMRKVTDRFEDDNLIVFIDRPGYSLSDDISTNPTVSGVVENYRKALQNAQIEAPYVLMPNALGGAYATYWESKYPDEIQGVVFLDTTPLSGKDYFDDEFTDPGDFKEFIDIAESKTGLCRFMKSKFLVNLPSSYSENEKNLSQALFNSSGKSIFMRNERRCANSICTDAYKSITANDIPKLYIESSCFRDYKELKEYRDWLNSENRKTYQSIENYSDYELQDLAIKYKHDYEEILLPYIEELGNCEIVHIPGDSRIYEVKPKEVSGQLFLFLDNIPAKEKPNDDVQKSHDGKSTARGRTREDNLPKKNKKGSAE